MNYCYPLTDSSFACVAQSRLFSDCPLDTLILSLSGISSVGENLFDPLNSSKKDIFDIHLYEYESKTCFS